MQSLADQLERLTNQLVNKADADMVAGIEASTQAYADAQWIVIGFALGSIALALALGYAISWSLVGPVKEIETRLDEVAAGDFTRRVHVINRDELGALAAAKRLEILVEFVPAARVVAVLIDPSFSSSATELREVEEAGRTLERKIVAVQAANEREFDGAFTRMIQAGAGALVICGSPSFTSDSRTLVALAARHAIPAIYDIRDYVPAGGLISYSASFTGAYRQAGVYAGRILKGAKPSELPVLQPTTFELVINLKTAKALGLEVPPTLLARADEVIE